MSHIDTDCREDGCTAASSSYASTALDPVHTDDTDEITVQPDEEVVQVNGNDDISGRSGEVGGKKQRNIRRIFSFTFFFSLGCSVALGPIFDKYLYQISGKRNTVVGLLESINGVVALISAAPVAWFVDKCSSRAKLARMSSVLGVVGGVLFIVSICLDSLNVLFGALVFMGLYYELGNSSTEALFADSCAQGERSKLYVKRSIIASFASATGPMLTAIGMVLLHFQNEWPRASIHIVLITGTICFLPCFVLCASFEDVVSHTGSLVDHTEGGTADAIPCARSKYQKWVPYIIATSDFITSIGAGMTVKFFNLFFINEENFTALGICSIQTVYPLVIALFQYLLQYLSTKIGRAQASFLAFSCNVLCFLLLWKVQNTSLLIIIFLIRGGLANGVYPIDRSIIMDYTPSSQRGRWNAVESFSSVTWSGSAFLGGYIVDNNDYRAPFIVTACLYAVASAVYFPLLYLVPRNEQARSVALEPLMPADEES
eukprot:GEMP01017070.1.p1 GENE.GEMP01017070.1~~GEMP01017070.1.p1  ORF type:complete len:487 (+),score=76.34 GEMP01017070.1:172-1632(+)